MDLALNNLQRLICHKTPSPNQPYISVLFFPDPYSPRSCRLKGFLLYFIFFKFYINDSSIEKPSFFIH